MVSVAPVSTRRVAPVGLATNFLPVPMANMNPSSKSFVSMVKSIAVFMLSVSSVATCVVFPEQWLHRVHAVKALPVDSGRFAPCT